jgi:hypothetical protein
MTLMSWSASFSAWFFHRVSQRAEFIDVNTKGLCGGGAGSIFGNYGEAYDSTGTIVAGAGYDYAGAGASYGGGGGNVTYSNGTIVHYTNPPYGMVENPICLGAGGGRGNWGRCWSTGDH